MSRGLHNLLLLLILALAALLRFSAPGTVPPGFFFDEARNVRYAVEIFEGAGFDFSMYLGEPLFALFVVPSMWLFGINHESLRLAAGLAGWLAVPGCYWAVRVLFGRNTALIAAFLLAVLPWHLVYSRIGFRCVTMTTCLFPAIAAFDLAFRRGRAWALPLLALFLGLGYHSYIPFKLTFALMPLWLIVLYRQGGIRLEKPAALRWGLPSLLLCGALVAPAFFLTDIVHQRVGEENNLSREMIFSSRGPLPSALRIAGMFVWAGDSNWRHNPPGAAQIPRYLFPFFLAGLCLALRRPMRYHNFVLWSALLVFLFPSVISTSAPHATRTLGALFPTVVFIARGLRWSGWRLSRLAVFRTRRSSLSAAGTALLVYTAAFCAWQYFIVYGRNEQVWWSFQTPYYEVADFLDRNATPGAVIWREEFQHAWVNDLPFDFHLRRRSENLRIMATGEELARISAEARPVYTAFVGKFTLLEDFRAAHPNAVIVFVSTTPSGATAGVVFRID